MITKGQIGFIIQLSSLIIIVDIIQKFYFLLQFLAILIITYNIEIKVILKLEYKIKEKVI